MGMGEQAVYRKRIGKINAAEYIRGIPSQKHDGASASCADVRGRRWIVSSADGMSDKHSQISTEGSDRDDYHGAE